MHRTRITIAADTISGKGKASAFDLVGVSGQPSASELAASHPEEPSTPAEGRGECQRQAQASVRGGCPELSSTEGGECPLLDVLSNRQGLQVAGRDL